MRGNRKATSLMANYTHEPKYTVADTCIVKCKCGWIKEFDTKSKAMAAWAKHYKARTEK